MNHPDFTLDLLAVAKQAATAGADVLASRNGEALDVSNKGDAGDWVTAFDVAAENAVRQVITAARPQDTITGEEHGTTRPAAPSASSKRVTSAAMCVNQPSRVSPFPP